MLHIGHINFITIVLIDFRHFYLLLCLYMYVKHTNTFAAPHTRAQTLYKRKENSLKFHVECVKCSRRVLWLSSELRKWSKFVCYMVLVVMLPLLSYQYFKNDVKCVASLVYHNNSKQFQSNCSESIFLSYHGQIKRKLRFV